MSVTNNVEYVDNAVIDLTTLDLDKCVRFVRTHASLLCDPKLTQHIDRWNSGSAINEGKLTIRSGNYNYTTRTYPEMTVWTGTEKFDFNYTLCDILSRKSLTKFKGDKAIKNNILALVKDYNEKTTARYSNDSEYEREPCCSDACLNMWLLRH
jgi:hypothetical protein